MSGPMKIQLQMLIKALVGDEVGRMCGRHPGRAYCLRWKRGSRPENKGRTVYVEGGKGALEWGQRASIEMTVDPAEKRRKLMKLGVERDGSSGPLQSSVVGECVIDATAYVGKEGEAKEFAFPIALYNKASQQAKLHIVFTTRVLQTRSASVASSTASGSVALSQVASETSCSSSVDGEAAYDRTSPRTLLALAERGRSGSQQKLRTTPETTPPTLSCRACLLVIGFKKAVGAGVGRLPDRVRLRCLLPQGESVETRFNGAAGGCVRWDETKTADVSLVPRTPQQTFDVTRDVQRTKVSLVLESDEGKSLSRADIDLAKYLGGGPEGEKTEYAFPLKLFGADCCKVQLSFTAYPYVSLTTTQGVRRLPANTLLRDVVSLEDAEEAYYQFPNTKGVNCLLSRDGGKTLAQLGVTADQPLAFFVPPRIDVEPLRQELAGLRATVKTLTEAAEQLKREKKDSEDQLAASLHRLGEERGLRKESARRVAELERAVEAKAALARQLGEDLTQQKKEIDIQRLRAERAEDRIRVQPQVCASAPLHEAREAVETIQSPASWVDATVWEDDDSDDDDDETVQQVTHGSAAAAPLPWPAQNRPVHTDTGSTTLSRPSHDYRMSILNRY